MSNISDDQLVRLVQRRLAEAGHYTGAIDGVAGKGTLLALDKALTPLAVITAPDPTPDSHQGFPKLRGVHPTLQDLVRLVATRSPVPFTVIEGVRTKERQAQLVKAGASKTQNSRHLTGHAVDLWPLDKDGKPLPSDAKFKAGSSEARAASAALWSGLRAIADTMKTVAKETGVLIEWGGDWGWDAPHFQLNRARYS